ncbi:MAG: hypothetical protein K2X39_05620 [Silvanigrellaceae bacterium]|nr:hypothetical protein [Silvanigrellaceae bacterium]
MENEETFTFIDEEHLYHILQDSCARIESVGFGQKKYTAIQKVMTKILVLPDKDFDKVFSSLEALVDGILAQQVKPESSGKYKTPKINPLDALPVRPIQNLKT